MIRGGHEQAVLCEDDTMQNIQLQATAVKLCQTAHNHTALSTGSPITLHSWMTNAPVCNEGSSSDLLETTVQEHEGETLEYQNGAVLAVEAAVE